MYFLKTVDYEANCLRAYVFQKADDIRERRRNVLLISHAEDVCVKSNKTTLKR